MPILHFLGIFMVDLGMIGIVIAFILPLQKKNCNKYWLGLGMFFSFASILAGFSLALLPNLVYSNVVLLVFGIITFFVSAFQAKTSSDKGSDYPMISWLILMFVGLFYASCYFAPL